MRTKLLVCALVLTSTAAMAGQEVFNRSFTVAPGGLLVLNASSADIVVAGADTNVVLVRMTVRDSQSMPDSMKLSAVQTDSGVTVGMLRSQRDWFTQLFSWWGAWDQDARVEVTVPRRYRVDLRSSGGDILVSHLEGDATGKTSGGDVTLDDMTGQVAFRTSGGDIVANTVRGDIDASTSGGDIRLLHIDGKISARTSGGDVQCEITGANRGISATTSGGDILLTMARGNTATLDAATSGGDIATDFPVATQHSNDRRLSGPVNGGGAPIFARTSGGDITLRVGF
ncbi:MAG: DUF4097 family beta strand repeat-containing protein [Pseudomonadota bacterium]